MCGVVGIYSKDKDISKQLYYSLYSIQHRGQESCGIAVSNGEEINYYKDMGLVGDVFTPKKLEKLQGNMGHSRNIYCHPNARAYLSQGTFCLAF